MLLNGTSANVLLSSDILGSLPITEVDGGALVEPGAYEDQEGSQYIGLRIHTEPFLLAVDPVQEIIMMTSVTYVPGSHNCIEGIISLRGEIMPIVNLRRLLGFPKGGVTQSTRVMIISTRQGGFGIIVDAITEFVRLRENEIESIQQNFFSHEYKILGGVAKEGDLVRGIIDIHKLLAIFSKAGDDDGEGEDGDGDGDGDAN